MKKLYQTWTIGGSGYAVLQDKLIVENRRFNKPDKENYKDWVKLTYNVTDASQPVYIFCSQEEGVKAFDIANVTDMAVVESGSRAAGEPTMVTPAYQYTFSSTGEHTVYVKFKDMTIVPDLAFGMCTALVDCELPNSVTEIGQGAFMMSGLTEVTIPNSVQTIREGAFGYCYELTGTLTIPKSVTSIGEMAFLACISLEMIVVDDNNTVYDSRNNCNAIMETATNTLVVGCKNTVIPNDCVIIGMHAFLGSNISDITIPSSVKYIGSQAFSGCQNLNTITLLSTNVYKYYAQWDGVGYCVELDAFNQIKENGILYVPEGSLDDYNNSIWMQRSGFGGDLELPGVYGWTCQKITSE